MLYSRILIMKKQLSDSTQNLATKKPIQNET